MGRPEPVSHSWPPLLMRSASCICKGGAPGPFSRHTCSRAVDARPTVGMMWRGWSVRTQACSSAKDECSEYGTSWIRSGPARNVRPCGLLPAADEEAHHPVGRKAITEV
eukprot:scaffold213037_cov32-Tisochrysis_lutea.AAC.3